MNPLICIPFDISSMDVLGQDGGLTAAKAGYARSAVPTRYATFAYKWTQAAPAGDFVGEAAGTSINLLQGGTNPDGVAGTNDPAAPYGYPASFGNLTERETNLYIGGRPCVSGSEFVMCAFGVRPMQVFVLGSDADPPLGALKYGAWSNQYQGQVQQAGLDNQTFSFRLKDDTCSLSISTAPHFPNPNSSGLVNLNAQNGVALRYNVNPLCKCLVIANQDGKTPNADFTVKFQRQLVEYRTAIGGAAPFEPAVLIAEYQVDMWGYCRWGCNEDIRGCLASIVCRTAGDDFRFGLCGNVQPTQQSVMAKIPTPV